MWVYCSFSSSKLSFNLDVKQKIQKLFALEWLQRQFTLRNTRAYILLFLSLSCNFLFTQNSYVYGKLMQSWDSRLDKSLFLTKNQCFYWVQSWVSFARMSQFCWQLNVYECATKQNWKMSCRFKSGKNFCSLERS